MNDIDRLKNENIYLKLILSDVLKKDSKKYEDLFSNYKLNLGGTYLKFNKLIEDLKTEKASVENTLNLLKRTKAKLVLEISNLESEVNEYQERRERQQCIKTFNVLRGYIYKLQQCLNYAVMQLGIDLKTDIDIQKFVEGCSFKSKNYKPTIENYKKLTPEAAEFLNLHLPENDITDNFIYQLLDKADQYNKEQYEVEQLLKEYNIDTYYVNKHNKRKKVDK